MHTRLRVRPDVPCRVRASARAHHRPGSDWSPLSAHAQTPTRASFAQALWVPSRACRSVSVQARTAEPTKPTSVAAADDDSDPFGGGPPVGYSGEDDDGGIFGGGGMFGGGGLAKKSGGGRPSQSPLVRAAATLASVPVSVQPQWSPSTGGQIACRLRWACFRSVALHRCHSAPIARMCRWRALRRDRRRR